VPRCTFRPLSHFPGGGNKNETATGNRCGVDVDLTICCRRRDCSNLQAKVETVAGGRRCVQPQRTRFNRRQGRKNNHRRTPTRAKAEVEAKTGSISALNSDEHTVGTTTPMRKPPNTYPPKGRPDLQAGRSHRPSHQADLLAKCQL
jgi:hypothetical protein